MSIGYAGLQGAFAKTEDYGISFHFTNVVKDIEGTGINLLQYSYINLKKDAIHWLKETGRIP